MKAVLVSLVFLFGCATVQRPTLPTTLPDQTELERSTVAAGMRGWNEAGLVVVDGTNCHVKELRVLMPKTIDEYHKLCPANTAGCAAIRWFVPTAIMSPTLPMALVPHNVLHEYMHTLGYCYGRWTFDDPWNHWHTDVEVFAGPGSSRPNSAEQRGQRILDGVDP